MLIRQPINFEEGGGLPQARIQHAFQGRAERDGCIPEARRPARALAGASHRLLEVGQSAMHNASLRCCTPHSSSCGMSPNLVVHPRATKITCSAGAGDKSYAPAHFGPVCCLHRFEKVDFKNYFNANQVSFHFTEQLKLTFYLAFRTHVC
jgi:hypothetical protein